MDFSMCVYFHVIHRLCVCEQLCMCKEVMKGMQTNELFGKLWVSMVMSAILCKLCCYDLSPVEVVPPASLLISPVQSFAGAS